MEKEKTVGTGKPPTITPPVVGKTATEQGIAKKKVEAAPAVPPTPKIPSVVVDFKRCKEELRGKTTLPEDTIHKVNDKRSLAIYPVLVSVISKFIEGEKLDVPVIIPRKTVLNSFCIESKLTPINCKKENKTENATISTYGIVPKFEDTFESGDVKIYKLFAFLRHPILTAKTWVVVKYGTYLVVMSPTMFMQFTAGKLLEDMDVKLVGESKKSA